tara:strand:- start:37 stop:309 length:273 start_codon:yes stop_codon:yes gene_type:complete
MKLPVNYTKLRYSRKRIVREEYIKLQNGLCYYCNKPLKEKAAKDKPVNIALFPKGFFQWPIHLHHNHDTGMTIGAVHNYCNAVLCQYHGE